MNITKKRRLKISLAFRCGEMDKIILKDAKFLASIGITEEEQAKKQELHADITLGYDLRKSAATDDVEDTINYGKVYGTLKQVAEKQSYHLLESLAEVMCDEILQHFPVVHIRIVLKKLRVKQTEYCGVIIVSNRLEV